MSIRDVGEYDEPVAYDDGGVVPQPSIELPVVERVERPDLVMVEGRDWLVWVIVAAVVWILLACIAVWAGWL